ncbi:hypothetical protein GIB67_012247 [Kingdonia uniflora]|uniref:Uncharacterized protein n=1 Tax=Kingdonia uniflora TaxID=39325 RepID=A0A7J7M921_9MAGN|nr:hypothetical protein GIB67_012247 [Kingdonia uniflora]
MALSTSQVYRNVIEETMNKIKEDFMGIGVEESVINELQGLWEMKMIHCGALLASDMPTVPRMVVGGNGSINPVHDLNVPYEGPDEYETPTVDILFPPTPLQTPIQTPLPGTTENSMYQIQTPNDYPSSVHDVGPNDVKPGRPSPYMQPPSPWMHQRPLGVDVNVAYVEGRDDVERGTANHPTTQDFFTASSGKRKREAPQFHGGGCIPQQDGAGDTPFDVFQTEIFSLTWLLIFIFKPYPYQGVASEDYNIVNTPASHDLQIATPAIVAQNEGGDDDIDEEPLNEDDDEIPDDDEVPGIEDPANTVDLVLSQFEKVNRTKSRWKCILKEGIIRINNKDILFSKANGEFDF